SDDAADAFTIHYGDVGDRIIIGPIGACAASDFDPWLARRESLDSGRIDRLALSFLLANGTSRHQAPHTRSVVDYVEKDGPVPLKFVQEVFCFRRGRPAGEDRAQLCAELNADVLGALLRRGHRVFAQQTIDRDYFNDRDNADQPEND